MVPTVLALAGFSEQELHKRYPALKGHDLSSLWANPDSDGPRGSPQNPGKGALFTFDIYVNTNDTLANGTVLLNDVTLDYSDVTFTLIGTAVDNNYYSICVILP